MERPHQDKLWLTEQLAAGKSSKDIANENNISYKLVEIYLQKFDIPFIPKERH